MGRKKLRQKDVAQKASLDEGKLSRILSEQALPNLAEALRLRVAFKELDPLLWSETPRRGAA